MNRFDEKLRAMAKAEPREIPNDVQMRIDETLQNLPEAPQKKRPALRVLKRVSAVAASAAVLFLFVLPNLSTAYARSLQQVPVLGKWIEVVTIRKEIFKNDTHELEVEVPQLQEGGTAGDWVNQDVDALTKRLVNQFYSDLQQDGGNGHSSISMTYKTVQNTDAWFTLKISVREIQASSYQTYRYYHIDKASGQIVQLSDLFADSRYIAVLTADIRAQMQKQMQENPDVVYWTDEEEFGDPFVAVAPTQNFYWDAQGRLVLVFDQYEVGPGAVGTPEFPIEKDVFEPLLKPDYAS